MKALDLFCGAGGASMGIHRAGFEVTGVDILPQKNYPFRFIQADAMTFDLSGYGFIWASPPCQAHSALRHLHTDIRYKCFIAKTREKLKAFKGPWIIENVPGAPLNIVVMLCGSSFGLKVRRHRIFESNIPLFGRPCKHAEQGSPLDVSGTGGRRLNLRKNDHGGGCNRPNNITEASAAIGIDWMNRYEISQAIPPAYSEFLCRQIMKKIS